MRGFTGPIGREQLEPLRLHRGPGPRQQRCPRREAEMAEDSPHHLGVREEREHHHRHAPLPRGAPGTRERVHRQYPPEELRPGRPEPGSLLRGISPLGRGGRRRPRGVLSPTGHGPVTRNLRNDRQTGGAHRKYLRSHLGTRVVRPRSQLGRAHGDYLWPPPRAHSARDCETVLPHRPIPALLDPTISRCL